MGQAVAGLHDELSLAVQRRQQFGEFDAGQRSTRADDADALSFAGRHSGFECRFYAHHWQGGVACAGLVDGGGRGRIACDHQCLYVVVLEQVVGDGVGARCHKGVAPLAVGRIAAVGQIHKTFVGQFCT